MQDGRKAVWIIPYVSVAFFPSLKPQPEEIPIAKHFYCGNTLPLLIKIEKLIQISVLIAGEAHAKMRFIWQN